jgi:hypothetical protein
MADAIHQHVWHYEWGDYTGAAGYAEDIAPLIAAGTPAGWVCVETIGPQDCPPDPDAFPLVLSAADTLVLTRDADDVTVPAATLASNGMKVVVVEWRKGPIPAALVRALTQLAAKKKASSDK